MQLLKDRIRADGKVLPGNILKVGGFLNHQMDIGLFNEIGREFARRFSGVPVDRILTIEASGIGIACVAAQYFGHVPVVFAKKAKGKNLSGETLATSVKSYTHNTVYDVVVAREFLPAGESVLIIDDFLANGCAIEGLIDLVDQACARLSGAGIVIEKGFQEGGRRLRERGVRLESLAIVESMTDSGEIEFRES